MSDPKLVRLDLIYEDEDDYESAWMAERDNGHFVRYSDYERLAERVRELERKNSHLVDELTPYRDGEFYERRRGDRAIAERDSVEAENAKLREALDYATMGGTGYRTHNGIRQDMPKKVALLTRRALRGEKR